MQTFRNILFVSIGANPGQESILKAITLALNNKSKIKVLICHPKLPDNISGGLQDYEEFLINKVKASIHSVCASIKADISKLDISYAAEGDGSPALSIIRHVLRDSFDLVVKQTEASTNKNGFKALDMALLRKCPCPVFLCRDSKPQHDKLNIAVAIDSESTDIVGHDLSVQLIQLASSIADLYDANLTIVSCWFYEYESELSEGSWYAISEESLREIIKEIHQRHDFNYDKIVKESNINGKYQKLSIKGRPEEEIPSFVEKNAVDILIMGTVARTGISGLLIGNTAENILQQLSCSLLAKKPDGFVSSVTI